MSSRRTTLKKVAKELAQDPLRSPLFHWMLECYETLAPSAVGPRPNWRALRDKAMREKVVDGDGKAPTTRATRETWRKVEREVAARRSQQLAGVMPTRHQPSRAPVTWQPPVARFSSEARPTSAGRTITSAPPPAFQNPSASGAVSEEEDSFDRAFRRLAERSGR